MKYTDESYESLASQSYGYNHQEFLTNKDFHLTKRLYKEEYVEHLDDTGDKIPHKIHQVWIGGNLPNEYKRFADSWSKFHPDWEYKLWTDEDAKTFGMKNKHFFDVANTKGQKSDIFRYEILNRHGGLYVDTDFECLKPFNDLMYLNFFTSSGYTDKLELYIGLIACTPNHPIIARCVNDMQGVHSHNSVMDVFNTTGSYYFTRCFLREAHKDGKGIVAFPMGFFYPWPNNVRGDKQPYRHVKPYSYAIHHWAISWLLKK